MKSNTPGNGTWGTGERYPGNRERGTGEQDPVMRGTWPGKPENRIRATGEREPGNGTWGTGECDPGNGTRKTGERDLGNGGTGPGEPGNGTEGMGTGEWGTGEQNPGRGDLVKESNKYCIIKNYQIIENPKWEKFYVLTKLDIFKKESTPHFAIHIIGVCHLLLFILLQAYPPYPAWWAKRVAFAGLQASCPVWCHWPPGEACFICFSAWFVYRSACLYSLCSLYL